MSLKESLIATEEKIWVEKNVLKNYLYIKIIRKK